MKESLFKEFPKVSSKEWKQKIQFDLKGLDYNETLVWNSPEGIDVKPFYHQDDIKESQSLFSTGIKTWKILESIYVVNPSLSNSRAVDLLARGAESLRFILASPDVKIDELLKGIEIEKIPIHLTCEFNSFDILQNIENFKSKTDQNTSFIFIENDIIGNLTKSGNWYNNKADDFEKFEAVFSNSQIISVDTSIYQNAGANIVQQLAYGLAHANEYLNHLNQSNKLSNNFKTYFKVAVGSNYFFEIAKLKAIRWLCSTLLNDYGVSTEIQLITKPSTRNKTVYDYNTNMLRTTTECMSAILSGTDYVENLAYDVLFHKDNEFGNRISRNQLLVLRHESHFDNVSRASEGSYYLESITEQLANKALTIFKEIEANGGFLHQLKEGKIQAKIKESANAEQTAFNNGDLKLIGTNFHLNKKDKLKGELEIYPFLKHNPRKTLIEPIIEKRLAEKMEKERFDAEEKN